MTFHSFLSDNRIIGLKDIEKRTTFGENDIDDALPLKLCIAPLDYMLGVSDLTGELMRFCVRCEGLGDTKTCEKICQTLKEIHIKFTALGYIQSKDLYHKMITLQSSLKKVEAVCYSLHLRKTELPDDSALSIPSVIDTPLILD